MEKISHRNTRNFSYPQEPFYGKIERLRYGKTQNFKPVRIHTLASFWETGACHAAFPIHFSHRGTPDGKNDIIFPMTKKQVWFQS